MLSRILIFAAAVVFIHGPLVVNATQPTGQSLCSFASTRGGSNTPQQLSPSGVLQLRSLLSGLQSVDVEEKTSNVVATEAQEFYACLEYSLPWISGGQPTVQARKIVEKLSHADEKGLWPEHYDGPLWGARLASLSNSSEPSEDAEIQFDLNLTVSTMRYLSDLHVGRVNPQDLHFELATDGKSLDLSEFLQRELVNANNVDAVVESVEPQFLTYRRTLQALHIYEELARKDDGEELPVPSAPIYRGNTYAGLDRLVALLKTLGDLDASDTKNRKTYDRKISDAVKHFQRRHGLEPNGFLDGRTVVQLNTPLSQRVLQLELALERWRWLPQNFFRPPIIVNIPEFRLYVVNESHHVEFSMNIVVGRAYHHETPVFVSEIRSIIFRPSWTVPLTIARNEIVPRLKKNPLYLEENSYDVLDSRKNVIESPTTDPKLNNKLLSGEWFLRQRPGPENSLGLIKFDLPDRYDVYLHGTPATSLFAKSRRDFSHGCIRVEDPAALAAWVLRKAPEWNEERIESAMNADQTIQINLDEPVPTWILYGTAVVHEDGDILFFADIYGHDAALRLALEQRDSQRAH